MLFGLFRRKSREAEHKVYCEIVAQARQPVFYQDYGVPDTLDGRFDMIVLHSVLLFRRLRGEGEKVAYFAQNVFDLFFKDMDASLRELGVSDVRVPKKIKAMGEAFYGRADSYMTAIEASDVEALGAAIARNVFPDLDNAPDGALALARYMIASAGSMDALETQAILAANLGFADAEAFAPQELPDVQGDNTNGQ
ncbi:ubiquinol-cytochrome C chaperone [Roseibium sp. CAU 1637]|uniref:Ubiquinol-cytochrome C chaperone n=2 Tax=Stappiaceae TaxID=2821832 RepID=A0A939J946_9HYPH|nr:ubiquinol-cytochrome C chaperone [Roseibium limicola]